jgi:hypothetical protein
MLDPDILEPLMAQLQAQLSALNAQDLTSLITALPAVHRISGQHLLPGLSDQVRPAVGMAAHSLLQQHASQAWAFANHPRSKRSSRGLLTHRACCAGGLLQVLLKAAQLEPAALLACARALTEMGVHCPQVGSQPAVGVLLAVLCVALPRLSPARGRSSFCSSWLGRPLAVGAAHPDCPVPTPACPAGLPASHPALPCPPPAPPAVQLVEVLRDSVAPALGQLQPRHVPSLLLVLLRQGCSDGALTQRAQAAAAAAVGVLAARPADLCAVLRVCWHHRLWPAAVMDAVAGACQGQLAAWPTRELAQLLSSCAAAQQAQQWAAPTGEPWLRPAWSVCCAEHLHLTSHRVLTGPQGGKPAASASGCLHTNA